MPEIFFTLLILPIIWGAYRYIHATSEIEVARPAPKPPKDRPLQEQLRNPITAIEHGRKDMLFPILSILYTKPDDAMFAMKYCNEHPLQLIAEKLCEDGKEWRLKKYSDMDINSGRTSRKYLASPDSQDFAQYVLGGRQILDELDKKVQIIHDEKRLERARIEALQDSDRHFNLTRTELKKIQNPQVRAKSEQDEFDEQMKELENGN